MIKIIGIVFLTLICSLLLKNKQPGFSIIISTSGMLLIIGITISSVVKIKDKIQGFTHDISSISPYISLMIKTLIIVVLSQLISDLCRDSGNSALASATETSTKIVVVAMCLPLFENVLSIILGLVK